MSTKRQVRFTTARVVNPDTSEPELEVRATTKIEGKSITAQGADEATAIRKLKTKVEQELQRREFKAQYPRTEEVSF